VDGEPANRAVIFDMDGVLTDSEPLINAAAVEMFKEMGLEVKPEDFIPFVGTGEDRYLGGVAAKHNFIVDVSQAKRRTYEIYLRLVPSRLNAFPRAVELVRACKAAGLMTAVASSADRIKVQANLEKIGLPPEAWDAIVTAEDVENKKPAPDIFLAAARKLRLSPQQCVVIEDAVNGIEAAKSAGMACVAVAHSFVPGELRAADLVRDRIGELSVSELTAVRPRILTPGPASVPPLLTRLAVSPAAEPTETARPWGFWATMGFGVVSAIVFLVTQFLVAAACATVMAMRHRDLSAEAFESNGLILALATCATTPVMVGMSVLWARVREGITVREYLGLKPVPLPTLTRSGMALLVLMALSDGTSTLLGRPIVPEVMVSLYRTAGITPVLWMAVIVAAPLSEEFFFRGFLFKGIAHSRLGGWGAVFVTSLLWAMIHQQYDLYGKATIFAGGLLFGYVRLKTGSLHPTLLMHALMNLLATIQVAVFVRVTERI
jgi:HAD superfamily hydrolase (TIGR01509 family)